VKYAHFLKLGIFLARKRINFRKKLRKSEKDLAKLFLMEQSAVVRLLQPQHLHYLLLSYGN